MTAYVLGIGRALGGSRYAMQPVSLNGAPGGMTHVVGRWVHGNNREAVCCR